jgi:hypothetical protein
MCTTYFNIQNLCILPSDYIYFYEFCIFIKMNSFSHQLNLIKEMKSVSCEKETEFLILFR